MKFFDGVLSFLLASVLLVSAAKADFILSIASGSSFQANSGIQSVNVFARNTPQLSAVSLSVSLSLGSGAVFDRPNAGVFGLSNYIGFGNIVSSGSSFKTGLSEPQKGDLTIEFSNEQPIPTSNALLTTLRINTDGLAQGNYAINFNSANLGVLVPGTGVTFVPGTFTNGSFAITAVPEPGSMLTVAVGFGGAWIGRRRLRRS